MKELLDLSLKESQKRQSPLTGFLHFCYEETSTDTIPLFENFCFALSLFRSVNRENFEEGKRLLKRLLNFQSLDGNFPLYLHHYPEAKDKSFSLYFLPALYWIEKLFSHLFEKELKEELKSSLSALFQFCKKNYPEHILIKAFQQQDFDVPDIKTSKEGEVFFLASQMAGKETLDEALFPCWNHHLQLFSKKAIKEFQYEKEPEPTLFDLFLATGQKKYAARLIQKPHPIHLRSSLIFPFELKLAETEKDHIVASFSHFIPKEEEMYTKGFHPLRILWGDLNTTYSFVCQTKKHTFETEDEEHFVFTYPKEIPEEKERKELAFFMSYQEGVSFLVNQEKRNTFLLEDEITIVTPSKNLVIQFSLKEGEGKFFGHISRGNRPSQKGSTKGFESYDWRIDIRSIERTSDLKIYAFCKLVSSELNEELSTATPIACMPLST